VAVEHPHVETSLQENGGQETQHAVAGCASGHVPGMVMRACVWWDVWLDVQTDLGRKVVC
jgi:hypothetical protein